MNDLITLTQGVESVTSLLSMEINDNEPLRPDLAKLLAESFESAHKSLTITSNITK
jgi:hypothetical protein